MTHSDQWLAGARTFPTRHGHMSVHIAGEADEEATLLLHGFPTWSVDWADVAYALPGCVLAPDLLGYGYSEKTDRDVTVAMQADALEDIVVALSLGSVRIVAHDYGTMVAQEILDRLSAGRLAFAVSRVALLNGAIVHAAYRPTRLQKLLTLPLIGPLMARGITPARTRAGLEGVLAGGRRFDDHQFATLWQGIARGGGHRLAHRQLSYIAERRKHAPRWEMALAIFPGPLALIWGLDDPVSGAHVLAAARRAYPGAAVTTLAGVGHYPHIEAPDRVIEALAEFLA